MDLLVDYANERLTTRAHTRTAYTHKGKEMYSNYSICARREMHYMLNSIVPGITYGTARSPSPLEIVDAACGKEVIL